MIDCTSILLGARPDQDCPGCLRSGDGQCVVTAYLKQVHAWVFSKILLLFWSLVTMCLLFFEVLCVFSFGGSFLPDNGFPPCMQPVLSLYTSCMNSLNLLNMRALLRSQFLSESSFKSQQSTTAEPWLQNRLRQNIAFWRTFCTSTLILSILTVGYHLPWSNGPPPGPHFQKNHPSAFEFQ